MTTLPQPPALDAMASGKPVALFLDFDGTLVEIAPTPDGIDVPPGLAASLQDLAAQVDNRLALVSGRAISDIEGFTGPLRIARAGSHGVDMRLPDDTPLASAPEPFPRGALAQLAEFAGYKGFALEEKPHGAALHYRANPALEDCGVEFAGIIAGITVLSSSAANAWSSWCIPVPRKAQPSARSCSTRCLPDRTRCSSATM